MLTLEKVNAFYGQIHVLQSVNLEVREGEVVSLLGANGAGKTTLLKGITGGVSVQSGDVKFGEKSLKGLLPHQVVKQGIAHVPENRRVFKDLTVEDNLNLGGYQFLKGEEIKEEMSKIYDYFPRLRERRGQLAGTMSGGEQQMLAIGRALMMKPKLLMLDEPSQGLAPLIVEEIFRVISELSRKGLTILLVEQNIYQALGISNRGYILKNGKIAMHGAARELLSNRDLHEVYLV